MRDTDLERRRGKLVRGRNVHTLEASVFPGHAVGGLDSLTFPLAYTDSGPKSDGRPTLVVIPGGPGFASVVPYAPYRVRIVRAGFRVVMVEHRGVGLSRRDASGADLPVEAMRVEYATRDILAVLSSLGIERAWLHGTSYGGYLAQVIGVLAPERVAGMFLDTTMFSSEDGVILREHNRRLFLLGESPETARIAGLVRGLLSSGAATDEELTEVVPPVYELLGPRVVEGLLELVAAGRRTELNYLRRQLRKELDDEMDPFVFRFDLAGAIWHRELVPPIADGEPFDTSRMFEEGKRAFPSFEGEPYNLREVLTGFSWPVVLFSGGRDTREPASIHREMDSLLPRSLHVVFPHAAHDLLRFRTKAVLEIEAVVVKDGIEEAARVASWVVAESSWHPQALVARGVECYMILVWTLHRLASNRKGMVLASLALLAVLLWWANRRRVPNCVEPETATLSERRVAGRGEAIFPVARFK